MEHTARRKKSDILSGVTAEIARSRYLKHCTVEYSTKNGDRVIRYHDTDILTFRAEGGIVLNTGGFNTNTTRDRMNEYLAAAGIRVTIFTDHSLPYLYNGNGFCWSDKKNAFLLADGMVIDYKGKVIGALSNRAAVEAANRSLKKRISKFVKQIDEGPLRPGPADCLDCQHEIEDHTHLWSHISEGYLPGRLIYNAMEEAGYTNVDIHYLLKTYASMKRSVTKYLYKRLSRELLQGKIPAQLAA